MNVIDMRCRPAYLHDFFGATPGTAAYETARWLNRRVGSRHDEHFTPSLTREGFLQEVHAAGLRHAVVVGRHTPGQHLPNDRIQQIHFHQLTPNFPLAGSTEQNTMGQHHRHSATDLSH